MNRDGCIYRGEVVHKRLRPVEHKLSYRVFTLALDVDQLEQIASRLRLFAVNRFSLFSLCEKDHGHRDQRTIAQFAWEQVRIAGLGGQVKRITMLFYPRILGFAFNPLTVYFCLSEDNRPLLMIYEVRNTFGENLTYILPAGPAHGDTFTHSIDKEFYVSPFNQVEGDYTFHVTSPEVGVTVGVALKTENHPLLRTHFRGRSENLSDGSLLTMFVSYPLMTLKVVAGIHWEALLLWRKGLKLQTRPPAPKNRILYGKGIRQAAS